jgi:anti-sigma factor RsiW
MSAGPCDQLHPFADGELSADLRPAFQLHLGRCGSCQRELYMVMMLEALAASFGRQVATPITRELPALPARTRHWWTTLVAALRSSRLPASPAALLD